MNVSHGSLAHLSPNGVDTPFCTGAGAPPHIVQALFSFPTRDSCGVAYVLTKIGGPDDRSL